MFIFRIDVKIANRMCNFAIEFDVENKALNVLCRASWLLDHDMFEVNQFFLNIYVLLVLSQFVFIGCYGYTIK